MSSLWCRRGASVDPPCSNLRLPLANSIHLSLSLSVSLAHVSLSCLSLMSLSLSPQGLAGSIYGQSQTTTNHRLPPIATVAITSLFQSLMCDRPNVDYHQLQWPKSPAYSLIGVCRRGPKTPLSSSLSFSHSLSLFHASRLTCSLCVCLAYERL